MNIRRYSGFISRTAVVAGLITASSNVQAQTIGRAEDGPIIQGFGNVYEVQGLNVDVSTTREYRAVFDVSIGAEQPTQVNARIETLARFLNMHGRAGVPRQNMHLALVLHGSAGKDALNDDAYRSRYGVANPNGPLIAALTNAGVRVYLCGQTAMHRGLAREELSDHVRLALSAMTMLVTLQADGYSLIAF